MSDTVRLSNFVRLPAAIVLGGAMTLYSALWMFATRSRSEVELGFDIDYVAAGHFELIKSVYSGGPAEKAGLEPGDHIVEVDGRRLLDQFSINDQWLKSRPGETVDLTIERPGMSTPFLVRGVFRATHFNSREVAIGQDLGREINDSYPVAFLVIGLAVLFLRLEDANAWLLALMFAGFIAVPFSEDLVLGVHPALRPFALAYRALFDSTVGALFYWFFAVFPTRSPIDRSVPWLKWIAAPCSLLIGLSGLRQGEPRLPAAFTRLLGDPHARTLQLTYLYGIVMLGFVSLITNAVAAPTPEARRKIRVILWGTVAGVLPATLMLLAIDTLYFRAPLWLGALVTLLIWLFPLSFAYAVVKHRVLEIPVLLRRSARYLLVQRGFVFLHVLLSIVATLVFALLLAPALRSTAASARPVALAGGVLFGSALAFGGLRIHKAASQRIDRAFFRQAYDARMILEDLAEKTRTAMDRKELAALLGRHLLDALQPSSLAVYLESTDAHLSIEYGYVPAELQTIAATNPVLLELQRYGKPREVELEKTQEASSRSLFAVLRADCLVPMLGRDGRLVGLIVLAARLSEEPYSREDKQLLASVASQSALALEGIRLGEKIAERIETERRAAQEMEYAKQVQARLFPQKLPVLNTLEYTGACIQARQVGGDYYDFLELAPGRLGLVLADIAGKGISGALLMANLQANLRSQYAIAIDDLPRLLKSVNQLFHANSSDSSYATLFFGDYDDSTGRLRYANCGHLPPLLLRACAPSEPAAAVERLDPTCTVLGLFENWESSVAEVQLAPGDMLVLYTDGLTEAENSAQEEFGERRLIEVLRGCGQAPVRSVLEKVVAAVQQFSDGEQADDVTLVVARRKGKDSEPGP
jgi:sigma-B regulation protein RsbU (phosphoserine phosphatase)